MSHRSDERAFVALLLDANITQCPDQIWKLLLYL